MRKTQNARDFTLTRCYYNVKISSIQNYCRWPKRHKRRQQIRIIGDARQRYQEGSCAYMIACDFRLRRKTSGGPLKLEGQKQRHRSKEMAHLTEDHIPPARAFRRSVKNSWGSGNGIQTFAINSPPIWSIFSYYFPTWRFTLKAAWKREMISIRKPFILQGLKNTDGSPTKRKTTAPTFYTLTLLFFMAKRRVTPLMNFQAQACQRHPHCTKPANMVLDNQSRHRTAIPRRFSHPCVEIWDIAYRLPKTLWNVLFLLLETPSASALDLIISYEIQRNSAAQNWGWLGDWWELSAWFRKPGKRGAHPKNIDTYANDKRRPKNAAHVVAEKK